jgi:hypothetical protein
MYKRIFGLALAAASSAAVAQTSAWQFYQPEGGTLQAFVVSKGGEQFILKCDKPGKRKVFSVLVVNTNLVPPLPDDQFESGEVLVRFDQNAAWDDNWRFNDKFAMAVNQGNVRSLTRLLEKLDGASEMEVVLKPIQRSPTTASFNVAGSREAIEKVYASCKDELPLD